MPERLIAGEPIPLRLFWRATSEIQEDYQVRFTVGGQIEEFPVSRYPTSSWQHGEIIQERYPLSIPTEILTDKAIISVALLDAAGNLLVEDALLLGEIEIVSLDRLFELPDSIQYPLSYQLGDGIYLRGADVVETAVSSHSELKVTLYWEIETQPVDLISAFVHLVQEDGSNFAQNDQWPGGLPSALWAEGQIIVDSHLITFPTETAPNVLKLAVGLYTAENGHRLTAVDVSGKPIPDNRIILPIPVQKSEPQVSEP